MGRTRVARGSCSRVASVLARLALGSALASLFGCSATPRSHGPDSSTRTQATPTFASDAGEVFSFPELTASPLGVSQVPAALAPFLGLCKLGDAALARVAERFARRQAEGNAPLDVSEISFALRSEGSP